MTSQTRHGLHKTVWSPRRFHINVQSVVDSLVCPLFLQSFGVCGLMILLPSQTRGCSRSLKNGVLLHPHHHVSLWVRSPAVSFYLLSIFVHTPLCCCHKSFGPLSSKMSSSNSSSLTKLPIAWIPHSVDTVWKVIPEDLMSMVSKTSLKGGPTFRQSISDVSGGVDLSLCLLDFICRCRDELCPIHNQSWCIAPLKTSIRTSLKHMKSLPYLLLHRLAVDFTPTSLHICLKFHV